MNRKWMVRVLGVSVLVGLGGCGERPQQAAEVKVETAGGEKAQMSSGRPEAPLIDPEKKTVTVLMPPSAPQRAEQRHAKLTAEHERSEVSIHELMGRYSENLGSSVTKARYEKQLGQELEAYKRRVLELHNLQRVAKVDERPAASID